MRIGFLYNHDAAHQVAHLAGIMRVLTLEHPHEIAALVAKPTGEGVARRIAGLQAEARIDWVRLGLGPIAKRAAKPLDRLFPFSRLMTLREHYERFAAFDAIISSERTCLRIKRALGPASPKMFYVPHGSGDRNVAHHPSLVEFDYHLVSGQKLVDVGREFGLVRDNARVIGYPKFDTIDLAARPRLFPNDNPVFLYNPHFDPYLSSVYQCRDALFDLFRANPQWNLIFAPHVMYGRKTVHYSLEFRRFAQRTPVPATARIAPNILVDLGSARSIDMTYTLAADAYIGDVSSQVYEFLVRPRACFFLDSHRGRGWKGDPDYQFWNNGPVVRSVEALATLLPEWRAVGDEYRALQEAMFAYTIDMTDEPASVRGARAIAEIMTAGG